MKQIYHPLRNNWKVDEDSSVPAEVQIQNRVDSEHWYTECKRYPNIKEKDITGKLGRAIPEESEIRI